MGDKRTSQGHRFHRLPLITGQRGSVLVAIIFTMVIIAGLGSALITMTSTATMSQFGAMDSFRAYYLAEAGGRYALPIIKKNINNPVALITQLHNKTFTLANNDAFQLTLSYAAPVYTLVAKGILNQGAQVLNATRAVTYTITGAGPGASDIPFDNANDLTDNWSGFDPNKTAVKDNAKSDNAPALNAAGKDVSLQLKWDSSSSLPNLATAWTTNGELLSYEIQVKIKLEDVSEYMIGLSFRERINPTNSRYGLSFLKEDKCKDIPSAICAAIPDTGKLYVVLWKNINGVYSVLRYHEAKVADNILNTTELKDWSTLVVKLEEQYALNGLGQKVDANLDGFSDRKNLITAYVQGTSVYARDTIGWDYAKFNMVTWDTGTASPVEDTALTSEDFAVRRHTEIGLHSFYPNAGNDKLFFDDFSLTLGSGGGGSSTVVQY